MLSVVCPPDGLAQSPPQVSGALLPSDYETELAAGLAGRSRLGNTAIAVGDSYPVANEVWRNLLQDRMLQGLNLPFQWQLALVARESLNAFSFPDGEVVVDRKLADLMGQSRGLWAALLSHEIAHIARRHWLRRSAFQLQLEQRQQDYSSAPQALDPRWRMAAFEAHMDGPDALSKFYRDLELEADTEGMMLMARTGFHPDFELALHHFLEANAAETSSFEAGSSSHPRWIVREHNCRKGYSRALEEFASRWPAAASSPGGVPPTVIFLGKPKSESPQNGPSRVTFSLRCLNPGQPLRAVLRMSEKQGKQGSQREAIEYWSPTTCAERNQDKVLSISSPGTEQLDREWSGEIVILNSENVALERSGSFAIHFSKIDRHSTRMGAMAYENSATHFLNTRGRAEEKDSSPVNAAVTSPQH